MVMVSIKKMYSLMDFSWYFLSHQKYQNNCELKQIVLVKEFVVLQYTFFYAQAFHKNIVNFSDLLEFMLKSFLIFSLPVRHFDVTFCQSIRKTNSCVFASILSNSSSCVFWWKTIPTWEYFIAIRKLYISMHFHKYYTFLIYLGWTLKAFKWI